MDFSTLLLGAALIVLPLTGAGLLAVMVLLERPKPLSPAAVNGTPNRPARQRPRRNAARRRR